MESNIQRIKMMLSMNISCEDIHDVMVPKDVSEEDFFLCYKAAKTLMGDIDAHEKRMKPHTTITRPSFRKPDGF